MFILALSNCFQFQGNTCESYLLMWLFGMKLIADINVEKPFAVKKFYRAFLMLDSYIIPLIKNHFCLKSQNE